MQTQPNYGNSGLYASLTFIIMLIAIIGAIIYYFVSSARNARARRQQLEAFALKQGLRYEPGPLAFMLGGSYPNGAIKNSLSGDLQKSKNSFVLCEQSETRGSGKNSKTYNRTIIRVDIPDTKLQMVINSKINNDESSGGNIAGYRSSQLISVEGEFNKFFSIYIPRQTEIDALTLLSPDVLEYIMDDFADYDIEIVDDHLYLYSYKFIDIKIYQDLLDKTDRLVGELVLRLQDARKDIGSHSAVARVADGRKYAQHLSKNWALYITPFIGAVIFIISYTFRSSIKAQAATHAYQVVIFVLVLGSMAYSIVKIIRERWLRHEYKDEVEERIDK